MTVIFSALWLGDSVGSFLTLGGDIYYHSPIQPEALRPSCNGWSTYGNFVADENLSIRAHTAQFYASRMINLEWVRHGAGTHRLFAASADVKDGAGHILIRAYPVQFADGTWSVMVINKDPSNAHSIRLAFENGEEHETFSGSVAMATFGTDQYAWHSNGVNSHADPNLPPATSTLTGTKESVFALPKASITVLRGHITTK
jgi:hypothetical protein